MYEGNLGEVSKTLNYLHRFYDLYARIDLDTLLKSNKLTEDTMLMHSLSWIQWGFYIFEWYEHKVLSHGIGL